MKVIEENTMRYKKIQNYFDLDKFIDMLSKKILEALLEDITNLILEAFLESKLYLKVCQLYTEYLV